MMNKAEELSKTIDFGKTDTEKGVLEAFGMIERTIEIFGKLADGETIVNSIDKEFIEFSQLFFSEERSRAFNNTLKLLAILLTEYDNR